MNIELCCAEEVAGVLGIEVDTLYRYARKGLIRGMKVGKAWRFRPSDIQGFLDQSTYSVKRNHLTAPPKASPSVLSDVLRQAAETAEGLQKVVCGHAQASYSHLEGASNQLADSLLGHGVVPGDRVLILLSNSVEFVAACFAVWKAGAIAVVEDPAIKEEDFRHIIGDCRPEALIVDCNAADRLGVQHQRMGSLRVVYVKDQAFRLDLDGARVESLDSTFESDTPPSLLRLRGSSPDDVATITYPRSAGRVTDGILNTHAHWLEGGAFTRKFHGVQPQDAVLLPLPVHHSLALRQIIAYMMAGAGIVLTADLEQAVKTVKSSGVLGLVLRGQDVKSFAEKSKPIREKLAASLVRIEIGATPLDANFKGLREGLPEAKIYLGWNLTEAQAAYLKLGASGVAEGIAALPPELKICIVDEKRREAPPGQAGLVLLKGTGVMHGFWGQSDHKMGALRTDGYCLGDRALMDQRGEIILLGRREETLEIRGRKVKPAEIEAVLRRHIRVADCAVLGRLEADGQTVLHAFVALTAKGAMLTEPELKTYCREFMESCMVPARIHFQAYLPKSADRKILHDELQAVPLHAVKRSARRAKSEVEAPALLAI